MPTPRLPSGTKHSPFIAAYCLIALEACHELGTGLRVRKGMEFTCANLDGLSGIVHTREIFVRPPAVVGCDPGF
jgi:hypothetical protein